MTILMSSCVDDPGSELDNVTAGELVVAVEVACDVDDPVGSGDERVEGEGGVPGSPLANGTDRGRWPPLVSVVIIGHRTRAVLRRTEVEEWRG